MVDKSNYCFTFLIFFWHRNFLFQWAKDCCFNIRPILYNLTSISFFSFIIHRLFLINAFLLLYYLCLSCNNLFFYFVWSFVFLEHFVIWHPVRYRLHKKSVDFFILLFYILFEIFEFVSSSFSYISLPTR